MAKGKSKSELEDVLASTLAESINTNVRSWLTKKLTS